ncbi:MAG: hypothetical protein QOH76_2096 [Thermoleophilaceae bacterium]|jgi:hypothetical protein|nr:hypothetical protein [Thermoleophilaceae bacterium]
MKVTMLLADAAQVAEGKLNVLGGGWALTGPDPAPTAIAMYIDVPWDQANVRHNWALALLDSDGHPVTMEDERVTIQGGFEVGRPPGLTPGTPIGAAIALNLGPLPLAAGRYEWRLTIGTESRDEWRLPFSVRQGALPAAASEG